MIPMCIVQLSLFIWKELQGCCSVKLLNFFVQPTLLLNYSSPDFERIRIIGKSVSQFSLVVLNFCTV